MSYVFNGILENIGDTEQKSARFTAREFVVKSIDDTYPQTIKFQLTQHRCELIEQFACGETLAITFDLSGREWNGRVFVNLNVLDINAIDAKAPAVNNPPIITSTFDVDELDDIPF